MSEFIGCTAQYDPQFWSPAEQLTHVEQMQEAGLAGVRLFEFCWSSFEPSEGRYEFACADSFLELLAAHDLGFILCTPGAVPPRWLTTNYPDAAIVGPDGRRNPGEGRRHGCPSSPAFMTRLLTLCEKLAERYGEHPGLIGWQIDNELGHPVCYCDRCRESFSIWLQANYGRLPGANRELGLLPWGREFTDWGQVGVDRLVSPQLRHAFRRWTSAIWIDYARQHCEKLREFSDAPVTTNMMAPWHGYDHFEMAALPLDRVGMDYYVYNPPGDDRFGYTDADLDFNLGYTRAIANADSFWILETTVAGAGRMLPTKGRLAEWTWRMIAHGADLVNYFRWDCPPFGPEESSFGVVGPGTWASPAFAEVKEVCRQIAEFAPTLDGTRPERAKVALLFSYPAWWKWLDHPPNAALGDHPMHAYPFLVRRHCHGLIANGIAFDLVGPRQEWWLYPCVVVPQCLVMDPALMRKCASYVEAGGRLLVTTLSGVFDQHAAAHPAPYPAGALGELCGVECSGHGAIVPDGQQVTLHLDEGDVHPDHWLDPVTDVTDDCDVLLAYHGGPCDGCPALTRRTHGAGNVLYFGTVLPQDEMPSLYRHLLPQLGLDPPRLPPGLWHRTRIADDGRRVHFLQNFTDEPLAADLPGLGQLTVDPHQTAVGPPLP